MLVNQEAPIAVVAENFTMEYFPTFREHEELRRG